jgi:glutathione S-transferase
VLPSPDLQCRKDTEKHEEVRALIKVCKEEYFPAFGKVLMAPAPPIQAEFRPKLMEAVKKVNAALNKSKGPYLLGSKYTLADLIWTPLLACLPLLSYFRGFSLPSPGGAEGQGQGPNLSAFFRWMDVCLARPSFAEIRTPWLALLSSVQPRVNRMPCYAYNRLQHESLRAHSTRLDTARNPQ